MCAEPVTDSLLQEYKQIQKTSAWRSYIGRAAQVFTSSSSLAASVVVKTLYSSSNTLQSCCSFAIGASLFTLANSITPKKYKFLIHQLRIEAIRLGIPLYFLLTQLYINAQSGQNKQNEEEKRLYIDLMMGLFGVQAAAIAHRIATYHFDRRDATELETASQKTKKLTLILENSTAQKVTVAACYVLMGAGSFGLAYLSAAQENQEALKSFGAFYMARGFVSPFWGQVEQWMASVNVRYEAMLLQDKEDAKLARTIAAIRRLQRAMHLGLPVSIGVLFFHPKSYRMGLAGGVYAILDEMKKQAFCGSDVSKVKSVQLRVLSKKMTYLDTGWKVTRYIAEMGGLTYFCYQIFKMGNPVDNCAFGSFVASLVTGFVTTSLISYHFQPEKSKSSVVNTLFFRVMESPEMLGMPPLYLYFYTVRAGIKIGNNALNGLNLESGILSFVTWGAFGYSMGQEMAQFESRRYGPQPVRIPNWLLLQNIILLMDIIKGNVS